FKEPTGRNDCPTSSGGRSSGAWREGSRCSAVSPKRRMVQTRHARKERPKPRGPIGPRASSCRFRPEADRTSSPVVVQPASRGVRQQVVIENRTGAGGTIGIETAIKSPPDGYSVLVTNDNVASAPHILKLGVDYLKELVPVIQLARQPLALAAHPTLAVSSV